MNRDLASSHLTSIAASQGVEVVRVHDIPPTQDGSQSGPSHFPSPRGSRYQFKTIQVNEDKEHQLDLRWLEAYRSQWIHILAWSAWKLSWR